MKLKQRERLIKSRNEFEKIYEDTIKTSNLDLITSSINPFFTTNMFIKQNTIIQHIQRQIDDLNEDIKKIDNDILYL